MSSLGWDDVTVIRKKPQSAKTARSEDALNAARRSGTGIVSEKKAGLNINHKGVEASKAAKVDRETEDFTVQKVGLNVAKAIQQGRQAKNLTQKDLATKINEKQSIVNDYETGKAPNPNQQVLAKMERVLGIKLRGKDIGAPLTFGSKK